MKQYCLLILTAVCLVACHSDAPQSRTAESHVANATDDAVQTVVTLLFTNDVESAYDPIPAFWLEDIDMIGGIAQMTTLIESLRSSEPNVFLFDAGDIFTGALAKLTEGRLAFELMMTMGYDAMAIGNHEFEYGVESFAWQKNRAPFPVLGANFFYAGTDHPFAQAHAIVERDGVRIGVIGVMGQDARTAIIPSHIAALDVRDPAVAVQKSVDEIRDHVDLVVLLTHQGKTAPMQTDAESDPRLQRDIDADIKLAGAVTGVDVLLAGHADAGTPEPVVHPETGTLIMQTYGQGTHLGFLQLTLDRDTGAIVEVNGKLLPVLSNELEPDLRVAEKLAAYRQQHSNIMQVVGKSEAPLIRRYIEESDMGNLFADVFRKASGADIGFVHAGSLRKDIGAGEVKLVDVLDAYPFVDDVIVKEISGVQLKRIIEQSLTLERGLLQVSGLDVTYDLDRPLYQRLVALEHNASVVSDSDRFTVAAPGFLTEGGDLFDAFAESAVIRSEGKVSELIVQYFQSMEQVALPARDRQRAAR